jgi:hypothetical protein
MNLQEFISESLRQIIEGISDVSGVALSKGAELNPAQHKWRHGEGRYFDKATGRPLTDVEFDIAVSAQEDKKTKGGIGIVVASMTLGSSGESGVATETISRVKFALPVVLPSTRNLDNWGQNTTDKDESVKVYDKGITR